MPRPFVCALYLTSRSPRTPDGRSAPFLPSSSILVTSPLKCVSFISDTSPITLVYFTPPCNGSVELVAVRWSIIPTRHLHHCILIQTSKSNIARPFWHSELIRNCFSHSTGRLTPVPIAPSIDSVLLTNFASGLNAYTFHCSSISLSDCISLDRDIARKTHCSGKTP